MAPQNAMVIEDEGIDLDFVEHTPGSNSIDIEASAAGHVIPPHHNNNPISLSKSLPTRLSRFLQIIRNSKLSSIFLRILSYTPTDPATLRPTAYLDGLRGFAAFEVYVFHSIGLPILPAWHSDPNQNNILQLPILRTFFACGAVSIFFAISGYVLTQKSLRWIRQGNEKNVYPAVSSSMFRRGLRIYLLPLIVTFCEMIATRWGVNPPLSFTFAPEATFFAQFKDWVWEMNKVVNPYYNWRTAMLGLGIETKYDPVIWTIPIEFYGSFVCYITLFILAYLRLRNETVRMAALAISSGICLLLGSWNNFCFFQGMLIADLNLSEEEKVEDVSPGEKTRSKTHTIIWNAIFIFSWYMAGAPQMTGDGMSKPMPGFETLRSLTPLNLMKDPSRFWWGISGVLLLLSTTQIRWLKRAFESSICQYLGRLAFSLYLLHEWCIVLFGMRLQIFLMHVWGYDPVEWPNTWGMFVCRGVWFGLFTVAVLAISAQVEKMVDKPSARFARWLEARCLRFYRKT